MNRKPETPNSDQSGAPLMLRIAYRAAAAKRGTKIAVAAVALVALGLARLNHLTEQAAPQPAPSNDTIAIQPQVPANNSAAYDSQPVDSMDAVISTTAPQPVETVTAPADEKKNDDKQTEWWLLLAFAFLAGKGVVAAVTHLEKNGYTMKRWEDKINKKKKRDNDPAP